MTKPLAKPAVLSLIVPESSAVSDNRKSNRLKFYSSEGIRCELFSSSTSIKGLAHDLTPRGVAIVIPGPSTFSTAEAVEVSIKTPSQSSDLIPSFIRSVQTIVFQGKEHLRLGIEFAQTRSEVSLFRLLGKLYQVPENLQPQAFAGDPIIFGQTSYLKICAIGSSGLQLSTSLRNASMVPGFSLGMKVLLPVQGTLSVPITILDITLSKDKSQYLLLATYKDLPTKTRSALAEYLLTARSDLSPRELLDSGIFVDHNSSALIVKYPNNHSEFHQILNLRFLAYKAAGKMKDKTSPQEMRDAFDDFARQLICTSDRKVVGAVRMVFVIDDITRSEHHTLGIALPGWLRKAGFIEISRACTDASYRHADVLKKLIQHIFRVAWEAKVKYVLANCNANMWPVYRKFGAKRIGRPFAAFGTQDCQLIYFNVSRSAVGFLAAPLIWNQVLLPINLWLHNRRSFVARILLAPIYLLNRIISPIIGSFATHKRYKTYIKKRSPSRSAR